MFKMHTRRSRANLEVGTGVEIDWEAKHNTNPTQKSERGKEQVAKWLISYHFVFQTPINARSRRIIEI